MDEMEGRPQNWQSMEGEFLKRIAGWSAYSYEKTAKKAQAASVSNGYLDNHEARLKRPEQMIKRIVRMLDMVEVEVGVAHASILVYNEKRNFYVLINPRHKKEAYFGYRRFSPQAPLVSAFSRKDLNPLLDENGVLKYGFLNRALGDERFIAENPLLAENFKAVKDEMESLKAHICVPSFLKDRLLGILILGNKLSNEEFRRDEIGFLMALANDAAMVINNIHTIETLQTKVREVETLYEKSHTLFIHMSIAFAGAIEARDQYTHGHTERVTAYCLAIGEELKDSPEARAYENFMETLQISALLHDIGKIGIPDSILNKNDSLTEEEFNKIKEHPAIGATILYPIRELGNAIGGVRSHQEKFDGTGYPDQLTGKTIPLLGRVIAVADAFDAITTKRPYKDKKTIEEAMMEVRRCSGTQFDPDMVDAFLRAYEKKKLLSFV